MSVTRTSTLIAGALAAGLALAPAASAQSTSSKLDISGGGTTLKLDSGTAKALKSLGVSVAPTGRATAGSAGVRFPITGGELDPASAAGVIRHTGGLRLSAGRTRVTLSDFTVAVNKAPTMSARVNGGKRLGALVPVVGKARITRSGLGVTVSRIDIHLSTKGAAALNKTFGVKAFKPRLKLGTATVATSLAEVRFTGGQTALALDPGAVSALTSLGVAPGIVGPAVANPDGSLGFPITGGGVNAKTLAGQIPHSGGISLTKGGTVVRLTDFNIDTRKAELTAAINGGARAAILSLDLSAPKVDVSGRTVSVGNVTGKLTQGAADALNAAFGTTAFTAGLTLGVATVKGEIA
ncbi:hypothetical protein GKE82_12530 [Conexibacter sp. W3-3-2]|uniref:hypothetical protein n=1 Tax=Conexibacter sp. W3-3-2 TaxID=2675227 RepID=UPI0012B8586B|nr:hypothetical protein [Conexibacter sp. W3-3-2]MTD45095.1 hypothetical protein [Conexibacter sp. W3-3-2]